MIAMIGPIERVKCISLHNLVICPTVQEKTNNSDNAFRILNFTGLVSILIPFILAYDLIHV